MPFDARPADSTCALGARAQCAVCPAAKSCFLAGSATHISLPSVGKTLLEAGTPVTAIYIVRAGCLKSFTVDDEGNERVRGFHLPGDIVGLDALGAAAHPASVVAVVPSQVCRVSMAQVRQLVLDRPDVLRGLLERTSRDLAQALALAGDYTADQRVAAFLVSMGERLGASGNRMTLPMTRRDIANYLRLATETVCRVLTRFESRGKIRSANKSVELLNAAALRSLAEPVLPAAAGLAHAA